MIVGVLASLFVLAKRYSIEQRNRAVEIAVDFGEMQQLSASTRKPPVDVIREFQKAGVTSLAMDADTIGSLLDSGRMSVMAGILVAPNDPPTRKQVIQALEPFTGPGEAPIQLLLNGRSLPIHADLDFLRNLPVGLPIEGIRAAESLNMRVVPRFMNYPGIDATTIERVISQSAGTGAHTVIFGGDQVIGFRGLISTTVDALRQHNLNFGSIEFGKQKGDAKLSLLMKDRLIRVHSIPQAEMATLDEPSAIERFTRAARERNISLAYVRLFDVAAGDPVAENADYVRRIAASLQRYGFGMKTARLLEDPAPAIWLLGLMAVGVAAGIGLLVTSIITIPAWKKAAIFVIGAVLLAVLAAAPMDIGRKIVALLSALTFPTLAVVGAGFGTPETPTKGSGTWAVIARFLSAVVVTGFGGLLIAGLLSSRSFMLKIDQFAGIKLAHLLPILLVLGLYASGVAWQSGTFEDQKKRASEGLRKLFGQPLIVWQAIGLLIALVLVALVLARSGNEPGVGVSVMELKVRAILDKMFYVRPRTKEFLFGHPLLFLGIAFAVTGRRRWAVPLIVLGTIGQVSLLNTFCHIHTPIVLSVIRAAIGTILGLIIGMVLYWIVHRLGLARAEETS